MRAKSSIEAPLKHMKGLRGVVRVLVSWANDFASCFKGVAKVGKS